MDSKQWRAATLAVHAGRGPEQPNEPLVPPICQSAVFTFQSLQQVNAVWEREEAGFAYTRMSNPNVNRLQDAFAVLHGAEAAVAAASGMAVIYGTLMALTDPGQRILVAADAYGGTLKLLEQEMTGMARSVGLLLETTPAGIEAAWRDDVAAVVVETISNPLVRVADIEAMAQVVSARGAALVVDNTLASPALCRPLELGASVVVESATKFLGGHSTVIAGVAAGSEKTMARCGEVLVSVGATLDPFAAWLTSMGMMTLSLRVEASCRNALGLARHLSGHPAIGQVFYPGLDADPHHSLSLQVLTGGAGALLAVDLSGGERAVDRFMSKASLVSFAPSLGDVRTMVAHPATTSHRDLDVATQAARGISGGLLRISCGIEDLDDLVEDFNAALVC